MTTKPTPRIVCAALKIPLNISHLTGELIVVGARHYDSLMHIAIANGVIAGKWRYDDWFAADQGFIDQFGSFHHRQEAYIIADREKQILNVDGGPVGTLYSEHLY